jgi:osmotically-inducible protein OsmY
MGKGRGLACCGLLAALLLLGGCNRQDANRLAKISRKGLARAEAALGGVTSGLTHAWPAGGLDMVTEAGIDHRVTSRLRWDKGLADTAIEVQVRGNVVELHGKVQNLTQRRRAVEIAETTTGVEKVTDALQMEAP